MPLSLTKVEWWSILKTASATLRILCYQLPVRKRGGANGLWERNAPLSLTAAAVACAALLGW